MGKIQISHDEFKLLTTHFKAPKEGEHICWKDFVDHIDEVFTKKELEKNIEIRLDDVRTNTNYSRRQATDEEKEIVRDICERFTEVVRKNRLNAKSFFQDFDKHHHFRVSQKIFRQVLTTHGLPLSEREVELVALIFGDECYEIKYDRFLAECSAPLAFTVNKPFTGAKSTYNASFLDFSGNRELEQLMLKIKQIVKRDRIRLQEFF